MTFTVITSAPSRAKLTNTDTSPTTNAQLETELGKTVDALEALDMEIVSRRRVAQVVTYPTGAVATGATTIPLDDTIPQNNEGDQYMSLSITPKNVSSTLEIDVVVFVSNTASINNLIAALFQDSTANALAAAFSAQYIATGVVCLAFKHVMTAGTTSATTFKVRCGSPAAGTTTFNGYSGGRIFGGVLSSRITIKEYLP